MKCHRVNKFHFTSQNLLSLVVPVVSCLIWCNVGVCVKVYRPTDTGNVITKTQSTQICHRDSDSTVQLSTVTISLRNDTTVQWIYYKCTAKLAHWLTPFDAHCYHMGTAIKHPVPDHVKPSFVIFNIRALWHSGLSVRVPKCQKLQMTV